MPHLVSPRETEEHHYANDGEAYDGLFRGQAGVAYKTPLGSVGDVQCEPRGTITDPFHPATIAEARALPIGAHFVDPTGTLRVRH